jgi:CubicO group peptidase (beta-lactamase class C family)
VPSSTKKRRFTDVEALLSRVAEEHSVPGLAVAVMAEGELVHVATHGWRDRERGLPMNDSTPSRWYSISKPITALALAQLVARGRLRWDDVVSRLVPGVRFADPVATERADIRDCLLHRTGLPDGNWTWWQAPSDPRELLDRLPHLPCFAGFRSGHHYQNLGFTLLGEVFRACGTTWHQAIQDLLQPLGIRPLTRLAEFVASDRMVGYGPNGFSPARPSADFDFEGIAPASAVCGTILELAKLGNALAQGGRDLLPAPVWAEVIQPELALPAPAWEEMLQPAVALAGRSLVYRGEWFLDWAGGWQGYTSRLLAMPSRRIAVCTLANRTSSAAADLLAFSLLDRAAGWEPLPWADRFLSAKRAYRQAAKQRLMERLSRPRQQWSAPGACGRFKHSGYGELIVRSPDRLQFRNIDMALIAHPDGSFSAVADELDLGEFYFDLSPELKGGEVVAWHGNPELQGPPCRFERLPDKA